MLEPLVEIAQGKLLGTISQDLDGQNFYSFRGIPYATPPIGELRFKAPQPPSPWKGIFQATENGNPCFAFDIFKKKLIGSEDCLNLNVYTPNLPSNNRPLLPVMVWIHGGGLRCGSNTSEIYGPEFLITRNVVLVTINYRLGILGFLSTNDPTTGVPGNAGFKDMVMALKWVQANISKFNGNPDNVTIFGESSGGGAVHLLMLSPMARGLFHKAISQSGCALNTWSRAKRINKEMYEAFDFEGSEMDFLKYLRNLPVKTIIQNQAKINDLIAPSHVNFYGLIIERSFEEQGEVPFLCEDPIDIILRGDFARVPLIIGYTNMEGLLVHTYSEKRVISMLNDFETNLPHFLGYEKGSEESKNVAQKIKRFYFGDQEPGRNIENRKFYEMVTDHQFMYGTYTAVRMHAMHHPVYFYKMSINTSLKFLLQKDYKGACHGDDVPYLFKTIYTPELKKNSLEYNAINTFVNLWTNFAHFGNPTRDNFWKKATPGKISYLEIDKKLTFHDKFHQNSLTFWNQFYGNSPKGQKFASLTSKI